MEHITPTLTESQIDLLNKIANKYDVDSDKLYKLYQQVLTANFKQDLTDIILENPEWFGKEI